MRPASLSWHRVKVIPLVKGMAAQNAPHSKVAALEGAIFGDGLQGILGTGRIESAAWRVAHMFPVKPDQPQKNGLDHAFSPAFNGSLGSLLFPAAASFASALRRFCLRSRYCMERHSLEKSAVLV